MSVTSNKSWICANCGHENSFHGTSVSMHLENHKKNIEALVRAELAEEVESLNTKIRAKEIEAESLKKINHDQVQSKIDLALARASSELNAKFLLDKQSLKNENEQLKKDIAELGKRTVQGSVQAQGETGEKLIEELLRVNFPFDRVQEVGKGDRGADCLLVVSAGRISSSLLIESKVTKRWDGAKWLPKLSADMERENATLGILVSDAMPAGKTSAYLEGNIWVCGFHEFIGITGAVRQGLDQMNRLRLSRGTAETTAQEMLDFLTSPRFASIIENMLTPVAQMREQLSSEKRAFEKQWRIRENAIDKMFESAAIFHGELTSIAGENIPEISALPSVSHLIPEQK